MSQSDTMTSWHDYMTSQTHSVYNNVWSDETDDAIVARVYIVVWINQKMLLLDQEMS